MATIIWCDRIKHTVKESRTEVAEIIDRVRADVGDRDVRRTPGENMPRGFAFFRMIDDDVYPPDRQIGLNVFKISSIEARGSDAI